MRVRRKTEENLGGGGASISGCREVAAAELHGILPDWVEVEEAFHKNRAGPGSAHGKAFIFWAGRHLVELQINHHRLARRHPHPTPQRNPNLKIMMGSASDGFAAVAEWIALDPDNEPFIFRKFDRLAARNLLYLQAQIMTLEHELKELDKEVAESDDMSLKDAARRWEQLVKQDAEGQEHARRQMELITKLKHALKEYCVLPPLHEREKAQLTHPTR